MPRSESLLRIFEESSGPIEVISTIIRGAFAPVRRPSSPKITLSTSLLALLWQILNDQAFLGFPWIILRDSWVVGDLEADHERELEVRS